MRCKSSFLYQVSDGGGGKKRKKKKKKKKKKKIKKEGKEEQMKKQNQKQSVEISYHISAQELYLPFRNDEKGEFVVLANLYEI